MPFPLIPVAVGILSAGAGVAAGVAYSDGVEKTTEAIKAVKAPAEHGAKAVVAISACVAICALCYAGLKFAGKG